MRFRILAMCTSFALAAGAAVAADGYERGYGPNPELAAPETSLLPTVKVAEAKGWPEGAAPQPANALSLTAYASGLEHPRWLYVLPNGDVLVAETNAPERPDEGRGIKGWIMSFFMSKVGASVPSANRITLLRGLSPEGAAAERHVFAQGLNSPFGMALVGEALYVACADSIQKLDYKEGMTQAGAPQKIADLPGGPLNHHWTKNIVASKDGTKLYASVGSNSNIGENGMDKEENRAAILEVDLKTGAVRPFATGLRNPVGMDFEPETGQLWTVVNERDELGNDLVPDYLTSVKEGAFYGWPYSYYGQHVDTRVSPQKPELVAKAVAPDYGLGAHTASLGLAFNTAMWPAPFTMGAFVGQHGSWNRDPMAGYKVIFVPFKAGKPAGPPIDVLGGFLAPSGEEAYGRPVGVAMARDGALLVADDVGNRVWRVSADKRAAATGQ